MHGVKFVQSASEQFSLPSKIAGAYCWFTSFGFGTREQDSKMFSCVYSQLEYDGRLVLEFPNAIHVLMNFEPLRQYDIGGVHVNRRSTIDALTTQLQQEWAFSAPTGSETIRTSLNLYTPADIRNTLQLAGFSDVAICSRFGEVIGTSDMRNVVVATKRC